ncbi:hypothetical protein NM208_g498 [Fusarium decemcellulare]|uniref:Uncharacterized protein n=1 Tax=Fusarium decemcellulare TaxID=57161 RepID=A0ACC1SZ51_9HYPO|nr:hypothetical protein NM208_g498 [Fusarium decemcellulare]
MSSDGLGWARPNHLKPLDFTGAEEMPLKMFKMTPQMMLRALEPDEYWDTESQSKAKQDVPEFYETQTDLKAV